MSAAPFRPARLTPVLLATGLVLGAALWVQCSTVGRAVDEVVVIIPQEGAAEEGLDAPEGEALLPKHRLAREAARRGELTQALALFDELLEADPKNGRLRAERGFWLMASGEEELESSAQQDLEQAAQDSPEDAWVQLTLGRSRQRQGDRPGAESAYRRAIELRPAYATARIALGVVLRRQGKNDESIAVLEEAVSSGSNADRSRALVALGRSLLALGKPAEAETRFREAVERAPASVETRLAVARAYWYEAKDGAGARAALEEAALLAENAEVQALLGRVLEDEAPRDALDAYQKALSLNSGDEATRRRLLRLALSQERFELAQVQANHLLKTRPEDPESQLLAGLVASRRGELDTARESYKKALSLDASYPEAWYNLGLLERKDKQLDAAIDAYQKALKLRPDYAAAANNLGLALADAGHTEEAHATWTELTRAQPSYAPAWHNLGALESDLGNHALAIAAYERALAARPGYPKAWLNLAVAQAKGGEDSLAIASYRALLDAQPRYVAAWYNMGLALKRAGDRDSARDAFLRAADLDPDHRSARSSLARLAREDGRLEEAVQIYTDLIDRDPLDLRSRLHLARADRDLGDAQGCTEQLRAILAVDPKHTSAQRVNCERPRKR